nr:reverse transcriptase domain-containing protein [Tanacetum cinerariifolium]
MSAMDNTTPIVTTVTKPATNLRDADATPRVNIQDFCEEYYEDILPIIMDKVRRDKRKEVHARLDFGEGSRERITREDSHHSSARARITRPERLKVRDRLKYGDRHVLDRLGHRRQSAFDRLSETYSPSTTKFRPGRTNSKDHPRGRSRPRRLCTSKKDCPEDRERFRGIRESYDDSYSHSYDDRDRSRHIKRRRDNESPLSSVSKSDSSDGKYRKSKTKRHKHMDEDDLTMPWMCEEEDPFTPRILNFESSRRTRMPNNVKTYDRTGDPEDHVKIFQAAAQVERWAMSTWCHMFNSTLIGAARKYVKDPVEIHNIKQKDGETIEDFIERFKVETRRVKGVPECMRISGFMHGVNNPELTKRHNEHVSKTMEEIMITTTAFIRGEAVAASKKKAHTLWRTQDQSKRQILEKRSDFRGHPREGRGSSRFTRLQGRQKKFLRPRQHIEELVRAGKLSYLIKEIKHGRDQSKAEKKEIPAKDKPATIYMIQSWRRMTKKKVTQSFKRVREITFPPLTTGSGVEGPLVIEAEMAGHMIHRMYVGGGASIEILYEHCFNRIRPEVKNQMVPTTTSLTGFSEETIWPLGQLRLLVTIGDADHSTKAWMNFMIVRSLSPYNGIIGRPGIREIQAAPSTAHRMLKFSVDGGIVTIRSTILIPAECTTMITSFTVSKEVGARPENFKVALHPDFPDQEPSDMIGVPRSVAEHQLNIRERYSPVRQKKRAQAPERAKAIHAEVQKLVEAGIMREIYYHDWLSNPVIVKKHDGRWRMCVDFTDLNKACPRDCYPLSEIDWKVESLCGYPFKCFLDAYKGYHQIQLAKSDEEKTAFHTGQGNIKVYVDDLVVKSHTEAEMLRDIDQTFCTLRKINMKLNPKKCTFGAVEGVFLGYVVTPEGMKPCPDKTAAELQLPSPRTIKEVQSLNGKLVSLNRFLFKSAEKSLPLFKTFNKCIKKSDFHWTAEAEQALKQLKQHLSELPLLVAPKPNEELIVYLFATYGAISAVLMTERGAIQTPVYFISRALQGLKLNYTPMEKLVLSLVFVAKRLQRTLVKGQVLADFLTEIPDENPPAAPVVETQRDPWTLFTDESSCVDGSGAGLILTSPEGTEFTYVLRFQFAASNNEAEYKALIAGLRIAAQMGVQNVHVSVDSKLVANQVLGTYVAKEENMIKYLEKVKSLVLVEILKGKSIKEKEVTTVVEEDGPTWMTPIMEYLKERTHPSDRKKARKLRIKARQYELLEGVLYRRSFLTPWLRCVGPLQAEYVIREIHEGSCSMHAGPRSSYARVMIELLADEELTDTIVVAMPKIVGEEFIMCTIRVEYWWKPSRPDSNKNGADISGCEGGLI